MSIEASSPEGSETVVELFGPEALIRKRHQLQRELGEASVRLVDANQNYNRIVTEMIQNNGALRSAGVETNALAHELQDTQKPSSASER